MLLEAETIKHFYPLSFLLTFFEPARNKQGSVLGWLLFSAFSLLVIWLILMALSIISILIFQIYVLYLTGILLECIICILVFIHHNFIKWYFSYPSLSFSLSHLSKCWHCFSRCSVPKSHFKSPWLLSLSSMSHLDHQEILLFSYSKYIYKFNYFPIFINMILVQVFVFLPQLVHLSHKLSFCFNTWPLAVYSHLSSQSNQLKAKLDHLTLFLILFNIFYCLKVKAETLQEPAKHCAIWCPWFVS